MRRIVVLALTVACASACSREPKLGVADLATKARVQLFQDGDRVRVKIVALEANIAKQPCTKLRDGVKLVLNGQPMNVLSRGGWGKMKNPYLQNEYCADLDAVLDSLPPGPGATLEISEGKKTVVLEAPDFFVPRKVRLSGRDEAAPVKGCGVVTLAYEPASDELLAGYVKDDWAGIALRHTMIGVPPVRAGVEVHSVADPKRALRSSSVEKGRAPATLLMDVCGNEPGDYEFTILVTDNQPRARTKVTRCEGIKECEAMPAAPPPLRIKYIPDR